MSPVVHLPRPDAVPDGQRGHEPGGALRSAAGTCAPLDCRERALLLWPGLDRRRLAATAGDPARVARLAARGTNLPIDTILSMLGADPGLAVTVRELPARRSRRRQLDVRPAPASDAPGETDVPKEPARHERAI